MHLPAPGPGYLHRAIILDGGRLMAGRILYGRGKAQIEVSGGLKSMVARALGGSGSRVIQRMRAEARDLYGDAYRDWPVASGKSKAALNYALRIPDPSHIEAFVANTAKYAFYIRKPWPDNNKYVYRELVTKPGKRRAKRLAAELAEDLRKLAGRG